MHTVEVKSAAPQAKPAEPAVKSAYGPAEATLTPAWAAAWDDGPAPLLDLSPPGFRAKLGVGEPDDPAERKSDVSLLEAEANRISRTDSAPVAPLSLHQSSEHATAAQRTLAEYGTATGGTPLAPEYRETLEDRLGASLAPLQIHTGERAAAVARALGTRAWTFRNHVGFARDAFAPGSRAGKELLVHEAVHVLQQHDRSPMMLLDDPPRGVTFFYSVRVDREMNPDQLLIAFIQQYSGLPTQEEAEAAREARGWHWSGGPQSAGAEQVQQGYVLIRVTDNSLAPTSPEERRQARAVVSGLGSEERRELYSEVDRRFWERTQYRPGEQLGSSPDDRLMAQYWLQVRDNLIRTRQAIMNLPEHVRAVMFDPAATRRLSPADYETALRVGQKLAAMSATELLDWRSRITAETDDWTTFEASLDAYLDAEAEHRREQLELGRAAATLYGLEELYQLRADLRAAERLASLPSTDEYGVYDPTVAEANLERLELRDRYQSALRQNGFSSSAEFEAAIQAWRRAFERETVRLSDVLLDRVDHTLFEAQRRYGNAAEAAALAEAVSASGAPRHYARSDTEAQRSISLSAPISAMSETAIDEAGALEAASASAEASRAGETAMQGLASAHPILGFPDFPRGRLGRAPAAEVQSLLLDYISEHRESIRSTRAEIHDDPDFIYRLDNLLRASKEAQGITPDSIFDRIINDYISDQHLTALLTGIAVAILTLALTIVTMGTGTLAVAAGVAAFGLSAWQAVDAFREYTRLSRAEDAQLLSEDPTIAWLVIAVVGAAVDLGAATAAIRSLRTAALALNETGDVAAFRRAVEALPEVNQRISNAAVRGAEAQAAIRSQWQALGAIGHRMNDITGVVAEGGYRLMVMAWHSARRGFWRFDQFLAELRQARIIGSVEGLTADEVAALRGPFLEGSRRASEGFLNPSTLSPELRAALSSSEIDEAAAFGRFLGLEDDAVTDVLEVQARVAREAGDPASLSPEALRAAMRDRVGAEAMPTTSPSMAEHIRGETGAEEPALGPGELSEIDRPRGAQRPGVLSGDIGEAAEVAGEGATRLPPTYAQHLSAATRGELRQIFSEHGDNALRLFADRLGLPANGLRQVEIPIATGTRRIDRLFREGDNIVLREVKNYPTATLRETPSITRELDGDLELLTRYPDAIVDWHVTGNIGQEFLQRLRALEADWPGRFRVIQGDVFNVVP